MKVRAKIALCTPTGTMPRGTVFDASDEQAARWIDQGKAEPAADDEADEAAAPAKPKAPKRAKSRKPKVPVAATPPAPSPAQPGERADVE
ncbi:hypothetical protein [Sphingomonas sp. MS122]|uniref:hypothetical protein n=1 Tax=Sphingomonas sp. MS122 TaxID=3412683 RepID=UPI003C2C8998